MAARVAIRPRLLAVSLVVAAIVGVGGGVILARLADDDDSASLSGSGSEGDVFPDVEVLDADGNAVDTGDLVGEPLVVNLWFSTCAPCRREMPALAEAADEYQGRVRFVGINPNDSAETMTEFAADRGVTYELYRDPVSAFIDKVGIVGFPTTFFVDADGTIVAQRGEVDADDIRSEIEALL